MSRKHNAKHPDRGNSRYPLRLQARGVSSAGVRMTDLDALRRRAASRAKAEQEGRQSEDDS